MTLNIHAQLEGSTARQ